MMFDTAQVIEKRSNYGVPIPFYLSSRTYGLLIDDTRFSRFDFGKTDPATTAVELSHDRIQLRVFVGDDPLEVIEAYTHFTGRIPELPRPWVFAPVDFREHETPRRQPKCREPDASNCGSHARRAHTDERDLERGLGRRRRGASLLQRLPSRRDPLPGLGRHDRRHARARIPCVCLFPAVFDRGHGGLSICRGPRLLAPRSGWSSSDLRALGEPFSARPDEPGCGPLVAGHDLRPRGTVWRGRLGERFRRVRRSDDGFCRRPTRLGGAQRLPEAMGPHGPAVPLYAGRAGARSRMARRAASRASLPAGARLQRASGRPVHGGRSDPRRAGHRGGRAQPYRLFPPGDWVHWQTGETYTGPAEIEVSAPLRVAPYFYRGGRVIPRFDTVIDTLVEESDPDLAGFADANSSMAIDFFGEGRDELSLWDGTTIACDAAAGTCEVSRAPLDRTYTFRFH